jgi:hypothetical protein
MAAMIYRDPMAAAAVDFDPNVETDPQALPGVSCVVLDARFRAP